MLRPEGVPAKCTSMLAHLHLASPACWQGGERPAIYNGFQSCQLWTLRHFASRGSRQHSRSSRPQVQGCVLAAAVLPRDFSQKASAVQPNAKSSARLQNLQAEVEYLTRLVKTLQSGSTPEEQVTVHRGPVASDILPWIKWVSAWTSTRHHTLCVKNVHHVLCAGRGALEGGAGAAILGATGVRMLS